MTLATFSPDTIVINLLVAMLLGMILGIERYAAHKTAGMRTYTLISMGSALFVIIAQLLGAQFGNNLYSYYIVAQVISAVGFLGVGAIFHRSDNQVSGITTASGLWVAAGIGMAAGLGLYELAIIVTVLVLFTFIVLWIIEQKLSKLSFLKKDDDPLKF